MTTVAVTAGPNDAESRTFECLSCHHAETKLMATDPLKSDALRWLSGELGREH
jgi:hypothetical protein